MVKENLLQSLGRAFRRRIVEGAREYDKSKPPEFRDSWIGVEAQNKWLKKDLPRYCMSIESSIGIDPMTAVSGLGNARRTDAIVVLGRDRIQFELKKADYHNSRTSHQLAAQVFDLGLGTYGATALYRIYADNGRVDYWTRAQAVEAVDAALKHGGSFKTPRPAGSVRFAPDITKARRSDK